ncbi:MAG: hypothetical protein ACHQ2Z_10705 [Elusimicrobiota bacterium]
MPSGPDPANDVFCIAPWTQLSVGADGSVSTCCKASSIQILPAPIKLNVKERCLAHVDRVRGAFGEERAASHARRIYATAINFLEERDRSGLLSDFRLRTAMLDLLRRESFEDVFPEMSELM